MAWNEPGDKNSGNSNKPKDPWGNDQGPPDLDEAFKKFKDKFSNGKGGGSNNGGGSSPDLPSFSPQLLLVAIIVAAVFYAAMGFYTVDDQERAVVLRFGEYHQTRTAGLHFNPPLIDKVIKLNVTKQRSQRIEELMLTEDENIVAISLSTQYTIIDPKKFLLEVRDPEISLKHATESALRHVVGSEKLHHVLTEGRKEISIDVQELIQRYLDNYQTGILLTTVNIEDAQPPKEVQAAFDDVIRAKEDEQRAKNEAETYRNGIIPEARGIAQRQLEEAGAYKQQVTSKAEGEADRFSKLRTEYEKAPKVTRQRLYIDTLQKVMSNSSKVVVDVDGGNLMYLPLDKLMDQSNDAASRASSVPAYQFKNSTSQPSSARSANRSSSREAR